MPLHVPVTLQCAIMYCDFPCPNRAIEHTVLQGSQFANVIVIEHAVLQGSQFAIGAGVAYQTFPALLAPEGWFDVSSHLWRV